MEVTIKIHKTGSFEESVTAFKANGGNFFDAVSFGGKAKQHAVCVALNDDFKTVLKAFPSAASLHTDPIGYEYYLKHIGPIFKIHKSVEYGPAAECAFIEITESAIARPVGEYRADDFGNEFNGGTKYTYVGTTPDLEIAPGWWEVNRSAGPIDGWGSGFKGGMRVVSTEIYQEKYK